MMGIYQELYHYGVKGMKWGVRRYQNKDGSLTNAGRKRAKRDADALTKAAEKTFDTYDDYRRTRSRHYVVDKHGANSYSPDGKGRFDVTRGIEIHNQQKLDIANKYSKKLDNLENFMKRKYDSVQFEGGFDVGSGKAQIKYTLTKNGYKTVSEFSKDYGEYEMPIKFVTMKDK